MQIKSPSFENNGPIPLEFTCDGNDVSPLLEFVDVPENAVSLALILHDPDAPSGNWVHLLMWNISPKTESIDEGEVPPEAIEGTTSAGTRGYHGPCPPSGTHRYIFDLYALDTKLELPVQATDSELKTAMAGHVLAEATLTGLYSRN
jgi:Raf kinase inhibitor-like YbhB/YbcL family protein